MNNYEIPELMDLNAMKVLGAQCPTGNSASTDTCLPGTGGDAACAGTGTSASNCATGSSASTTCAAGNTGGACVNGESAS